MTRREARIKRLERRRKSRSEYGRMTPAEIRRAKRRQYVKFKNQWEIFWNGSVYLPDEVSLATNTLQAYVVQFMERMDEYFEVRDGKCQGRKFGSGATDTV